MSLTTDAPPLRLCRAWNPRFLGETEALKILRDVETNISSESLATTGLSRQSEQPSGWPRPVLRVWSALEARPFARELIIFVGFTLLTAIMTWPWVMHLRDAVADRGDPYMIAWTLWWDYHQTFTHPLQLFHANIFYPYQYTLAFSENDYGIALLFFPLFAAGLRPLTVHSIATFLGFPFCGYGAFRLTRTLTGRSTAAWIAGIIFAFIPYRFNVLSHLHYLFAGWIPLMLEALILFARRTTWRRASWMGIAFFMNALTCFSWLIMTIVPLTVTVLFLAVAGKSVWRNREFWLRGTLAIAVASLFLLPFLWPYYRVTVLYGLKWQPWEFAFNSPSLLSWLKAETRNQVWRNLGAGLPDGHRLFPGLLAPILAVMALRLRERFQPRSLSGRRLIAVADFVILGAAIVAVLAVGYGDKIYRVFGVRLFRLNERSAYEASSILLLATGARLGLLLPRFIRRMRRGIQQPITSRLPINLKAPFGLAIGVGLIWTVFGFLGSLGAKVFFNRWLHDHLFLYQSIRLPGRAAMICYLGLAVLAGVGACLVANRAQEIFGRHRAGAAAIVVISLALLFELHASPLNLQQGEVDPSAVALRLRQTSMRGGLVELPSGVDVARHFYMLRAADHAKPLVNATSSFISPVTEKINKETEGKPEESFMDLLEQIPASYLVIHNDRLTIAWRTEYQVFLAQALASGRLRFINRFDAHDDLYAVVKTEPNAISEAAVPFRLVFHEWASMIAQDQANLLVSPNRSQTLYRIYWVTTGALPRYVDFISDMKKLADQVILESSEQDHRFDRNLREFAAAWVERERFRTAFQALDDEQYVDRLAANAGIKLAPQEQAALVDELFSKKETRAGILLKIVADHRFVEKEDNRSLVLLHYFAYLHRNPGDPPDKDLSGFNFWVQDMERSRNLAKLAAAFESSVEYRVRVEAKN